MALSAVVKQQRHEDDHAYLSSARVKIAWCYTVTPQYIVMTCGTNLLCTLSRVDLQNAIQNTKKGG